MRHVNTHVTRSRTSLFVLKISGFHVKLSTRNRVHSPADSLGRFTPRAHALKGVLPVSASPDACEPSGRLLYHDRYVKDHVSGFTPKTPYIILLPLRKNKTARKLSLHARHPESTASYRIAFTAMLQYIQEGTSLHFQPSDPWYAK